MIRLAWILNKIIQWQWEKWKLKISCQSSSLHKVRRGERLKLQLPQGKQHNLLALLLWKTFLLLYGIAKGDPKEKITTKSQWKTVTHNCTQNPRAVLLESKVCRTKKNPGKFISETGSLKSSAKVRFDWSWHTKMGGRRITGRAIGLQKCCQ